MNKYTVEETTRFFRSYGLRIEDKYIQEWVDIENSKSVDNGKHRMCENDIYDFNEWYRWKGASYEEGIENQTKIKRLLAEIEYLKMDIKTLKEEKSESEDELGILPF